MDDKELAGLDVRWKELESLRASIVKVRDGMALAGGPQYGDAVREGYAAQLAEIDAELAELHASLMQHHLEKDYDLEEE